MYWAIAPAILSELFGTKNFGAVYNLIAIGTASGGFALNAGIASHFYSINSSPSLSDDDDGNKCYGVDCYEPTFLICAGLCLIGALGLVCLARTNKRYRRVSTRLDLDISTSSIRDI